jgi:hypothetical protein
MGKTLIIGASNNPERYAYLAAEEVLRDLDKDTVNFVPNCEYT